MHSARHRFGGHLAPAPGLFDDDGLISLWDTAPEEAFGRWLAAYPNTRRIRGPLRPSTREIYRSIWRQWTESLQGRSPLKATRADMLAHLARFTGTTQARHVLLLQGIYRWFAEHHLIATDSTGGHPVLMLFDAMRYSSKSALDGLPMAVFASIELALEDWLDGGEPGRLAPPSSWKDWRDGALVAVIAGAGLRLHEIEALTWDDVRFGEDLIAVPSAAPFAPHVVRPRAYVLPILAHWRSTWQQLGLPSGQIFPGTRTGGVMHPVTIWRRVQGWIAAALDEDGLATINPRQLRNAYGAAELAAGVSPTAVMEGMGLESLEAVLRLLPAPPDPGGLESGRG